MFKMIQKLRERRGGTRSGRGLRGAVRCAIGAGACAMVEQMLANIARRTIDRRVKPTREGVISLNTAFIAACAASTAGLVFCPEIGHANPPNPHPLPQIDVRPRWSGWIGAWDSVNVQWNWSPSGPLDLPGPIPSQPEICADLEGQWNEARCNSTSQGVQVRSNGCGPAGLGWIAPESPYTGVSFASACDRHDECYGTLGAERASCDGRFRDDMESACIGAATMWRFDAIDQGLIGAAIDGYVQDRQHECFGGASVYFGFVAWHGGGPFQAAQANVAKCEALAPVIAINCG